MSLFTFLSRCRGNGAETDPNLVVKRSSYSYVSKSAAGSNSASSGGQSAKRPLGVRHLMPTQNSDSSLNSHFTSSSMGAAGAGGASTPGKNARDSTEELQSHKQQELDRPQDQCDQEEQEEFVGKSVAEETPTGLDETLEVQEEELEEPQTTKEIEPSFGATDSCAASIPASELEVSESVSEDIRPSTPVEDTVAVFGQIDANSFPASTTSSAAFADVYTTADNAVTLEYVTTASIDDVLSPGAMDTAKSTPTAHTEVSDEVLEGVLEALEEEPELPDATSEAAADDAPLAPAEVSREEDEDEEFEVMHDRGVAGMNPSPNHRNYRIKRSVDSTTGVTFSDMYDISENGTPVSDRRSPVSSMNVDDVAASLAAKDLLHAHVDSDAETETTSGNNVAFV